MSERMPEVVQLRRLAEDNTLNSQERSAAAFELRQCVIDVQRMIINTAPVIVTSCIGAHHLLEIDAKDMTFPIVVLDEAAQTTEPALICALASARAEQLVLVGDTRQLPPTVTCRDLRDSLGVSPMARLEKQGIGETTLRVQYRMPQALLEHPSKYFYNGLVMCADNKLTPPTLENNPKGFPWPSSLPLAFVQVGNGNSEVAHNFGGRSNPTEAQLVAIIVSELLSAGEIQDDNHLVVISPYSKQVQLIRTELAATRATQNVRVGTVDSFQGQETDVVVFSAVRSNPMQELGFLRDSRRLCVAITRAKRGLILVGDQTVLKSCRHWAALLESCEDRACVMDAKDFEYKSDVLAEGLGESSSTFSEDSLKDLRRGEDAFYGLFPPTATNVQEDLI
jgi:regulator of nonsense transcripts 1